MGTNPDDKVIRIPGEQFAILQRLAARRHGMSQRQYVARMLCCLEVLARRAERIEGVDPLDVLEAFVGVNQ